MIINWVVKKFTDLSPNELYAIMQLRNEVFVVEQDCVYQDADNKDIHCHHYMGWLNDQLVAYARILPPGIAFKEPSIGRVVTSPLARNNGIGRELMVRSIEQTRNFYNNSPIKIGAQLYLHTFYSSLGFLQTSDVYLEDDIEHIEMRLEYRISNKEL